MCGGLKGQRVCAAWNQRTRRSVSGREGQAARDVIASSTVHPDSKEAEEETDDLENKLQLVHLTRGSSGRGNEGRLRLYQRFM